MKTKSFSVTGSSAWAWDGPVSVIYYESGIDSAGQNARIRLRSPDGNALDAELKPGRQLSLPQPVAGVVIESLTGNAITGKISLGVGDIRDSSLLGTVEVIDGEKSRTIANMVFSGSPVFLASAGLYSNCQLFNPAGSGKNIVLKALGFSANAAGPVNVHLTETKLATDQTLDRAFPKLAGAGKGVGLVLSEGKAALVGPTMWGAQLEANVYLHWNVIGVVVLPPGTGITVQAGVLQATLQTNFEWFEEAI